MCARVCVKRTLKAALDGLRTEIESSGRAHAAIATWFKSTLDNQVKDFESNRESRRKNVRPSLSYYKLISLCV